MYERMNSAAVGKQKLRYCACGVSFLDFRLAAVSYDKEAKLALSATHFSVVLPC